MGYNVAAFIIPVRSGEEFGRLSNFLHKVIAHEELHSSETDSITYKYYELPETLDDYKGVYRLWGDRSLFQVINHPEGIRNLNERYRVEILIEIEKKNLEEIVEYQKLFLIMNYYMDHHKKIEIYCVIEGEADFYFKLSQYFIMVNMKHQDLYNHLYYYTLEKKEPRRLQHNRTRSSRGFMPLFFVDDESVHYLFKITQDVFYIETMSKRDSAGNGTKERGWDFKPSGQPGSERKTGDGFWERELVSGALKILLENTEILENGNMERFYELLRKKNILTMILFAYSLRDIRESLKKKYMGEGELARYIICLEQYAGSLRQLMENILYHSERGQGCLSIRIHSPGTNERHPYLEKTYHLEKHDGMYFEVVVGDYAGENDKGNIAENFIKKIKDQKLRDKFHSLTPRDFFIKSYAGSSEVREPWSSYYRIPEHIGKHFGLRIFESIVLKNRGCFLAESHSGHQSKDGEVFSSFGKDDCSDFCMPGTAYYILLPLDVMQTSLLKPDTSLDSKGMIGKNVNKYMVYSAKTAVLEIERKQYMSQQEKDEHIGVLSERLQEILDEADESIVYIPVNGVFGEFGEVLAKTTLIAEYMAMSKKHLVFYSCEDSLKEQFWMAMRVFLESGGEAMFLEDYFLIALFSVTYQEREIIPASAEKTSRLNHYIGRIKGIPFTDDFDSTEGNRCDFREEEAYIPFEILHETEMNHQTMTLFEHYTKYVLERSIQSEEFGCRISKTHMRLGSTIHINDFYEAEILFGNKLFVSRFAYLLLKSLNESKVRGEKLTLYGYATYSESLMVELAGMIRDRWPGTDVDYIILEREEERRGFSHTDRIRYSRLYKDEKDKKDQLRERKFILIVPINSTLKTHMRLIDLLQEENDLDKDSTKWILYNFALILVGSKKDNQYWSLKRSSRIVQCKDNILPEPRYFVKVETDYQDALGCEMCFPKNPIDETPLIEVNAASTIPNQAFGMVKNVDFNPDQITQDWIEAEERRIRPLMNCLLYRHLKRRENHFLFYVRTEVLFTQEKEKIRESLKEWAERHILLEDGYDIIVSPLHFSNAGFLELVNEVVFHGMAAIVRTDFDKEYRNNSYIKYSNIRNYIRQMSESGQSELVRIHFVDDNIITGRTFYRAKSLIETIVDAYDGNYPGVEIRIFDRVFVMIDRNSFKSRMQFIHCWDSKNNREEYLESEYYSYMNIAISSLRSYGDSCVLCNLEKEADLLYCTASTHIVSDYWKKSKEKFRLHSLDEALEGEKGKSSFVKDEALEEGKEKNSTRAYRRMVCMHIAKLVLDEKNHGNDMEKAIILILRLLVQDYKARKEDQYEYFLSYLKTISRPFLVFNKAVKEAIFDIMLIFFESLVTGQDMTDVIKGSESKEYLKENRIITEFEQADRVILHESGRSEKEKKDLILLLMKQLTELKSNYIIRLASMEAIFHSILMLDNMKEECKEDFQKRYLFLIKKLIGINSDTSKSVWLDYALRNRREWKQPRKVAMGSVPDEFIEWITLENTRTFWDGIEKLYNKMKPPTTEFHGAVEEFEKSVLDKDINLDVIHKIELFWREHPDCTAQEILELLDRLLTDNTLYTPKSVQSLRAGNDDAKEILTYIYEHMQKEVTSEPPREPLDKLVKLINLALDIYQFGNFRFVLEQYGMMTDNSLNEEGANLIASCLGIRKQCESVATNLEDKDIIERIQKLTALVNAALHSFKVHLVMEHESRAEEWKKIIREEFNKNVIDKLHDKDKNARWKDERLNIETNCEYMLLAGSISDPGKTERIDDEEISRLNAFSKDRKAGDRGYRIDLNEGFLIWKVGGNTNHKVLLYAEFDGGKDPFQTYHNINHIMMFNYLFEKQILGGEKSNYLYELVIARKDLEVYNRNKIHSHTKDDVAYSHFKQALCPEKYDRYYRSYVFTLLADLNVSGIYRNSLKQRFYDQKIGHNVCWGDEDSVFQKMKEFDVTYSISSIDKTVVRVVEEAIIEGDSMIKADDVLICGGTLNRQLFLLLLSLVLNAAGKDNGQYRAVREGEEKNIVNVYLSKTARHTLRIMNKAPNHKFDTEKIQRELQREPENEERGISMWGMSRYVKCFITGCIREKTQELIDNGGVKKETVRSVREGITRLLGTEFELQPGISEIGSDRYFWVEIPVLWKKYEEVWAISEGEGR